MENKESLKLAVKLTIATCLTVAISIFIAKSFQKVRKHNRKKQQKKHSCYLNAEIKPQSSFKRVFADNSYSQFKHLKLVNSNEDCTNFHPYKAEITELLKSSNVEFLELFGRNFEDLTMRELYVWVESESQLRELAEVLSKERVFAVDTEQHSLRSFLGFTALIQISTGSEDYLVDTIALHDVMGILRPVFANPGICKVFHGADNDVLWLQRDFHIYVVNLFDTAKACDVLSKPQRSLAYLLDLYCGIVANKLLQREDWRQRPLPAEMVQYARTDAHYLLYIAHRLSSELKEQDTENSSSLREDKFSSVLEANRRSNAICLQLFSKETDAYPGESVASSIISRYQSDQGSSMSSSDEMKFHDLVRRLCTWRDIMKFDCRYINRNLAKLIEEDPPAIMLLFEPKGRPEDEGNDFYIQSKRNICVGCGEGNHYLRYRIIPSCYRMHFPEHLKSHRSHDIVLLCVDCHEIAHAAAEKYKRKIATEFGIPLFVRRVVDSNQNQNTSESSVPKLSVKDEGVSPLQLRTAAMALLRHGSRMPAKRREELIMIIRNYYGGREISDEDLERAMLIGMSPNERRRFEKQRKLACKDSNRSITPDGELDNKQAKGTSLPEEVSDNSSNCEESTNVLTVEDNNVSNHSSYPNFGVNSEYSVIRKNDFPHGRESLVKHDDVLPDSCDDESCNVSNGMANSVDNMNTNASSRNSKLSLLGHGPHGKQVVNHILKEHGDEGISQFCQRWRQVFVEAVHPRFLPGGWDIMHSGRRDFGEFSVYKPGKRTPTSTPEQ
ncbi:PREDICTED: protein RRP6-like 3 isoform X3 [Nicotiana attenuata]|uniref:protein RRP6-like 3 isoform X3 n=1 Tax=Nicotiana attenuata TaxID=49451 RepID=UPI00090505B1|nr:PREDICTED: protein RRP6-like 3 isoform X3 [Nicotiana attenuata]